MHKRDIIVAICNVRLRFVMAVLFDLTSLRGKITGGYITLVVSTAALGIIAISDLLFLGRQVTEGEVVSNLKDAVLEMRREEKNLFLYADTGALSSIDKHAALSLRILQEHQTTLVAVMREPDPLIMVKALNSYRIKLGHWKTTPAKDRKLLHDEIRTLGHQTYLFVESLSNQDYEKLEVVVLDNGSTDSSVQLIKESFPQETPPDGRVGRSCPW